MLKNLPRLLWTLLLVGTLLGVLGGGTAEAQQSFRVVGYYTYYSIYEPLEYFVTDIRADNLTHLIYAYVDINDNGQCAHLDEWADVGYKYPGDADNQRLAGNIYQLRLMDGRNPDLKIMMSIGGWENSENFSSVAATEQSRQRFVRSCINFMQRFEFEGIDIDWRYPVEGGRVRGQPEDVENFPLLLEEFRLQLDEAGIEDERVYELSIAMPTDPVKLENYDLGEISLYVDFINMQAYEYAGSWSTMTEHQAPLYLNRRDPRDPSSQRDFTVDGAVELFFDEGVPPGMLVLGVPFYGQSWASVRVNDYFGLFSPNGGVPSGTRENGRLYYRDIVQFSDGSNWTRFFDPEAYVPWLWDENGRIAITYEDPQSIEAKANYVVNRQLGGLMAWELAYDDSEATLLRAMHTFLNAAAGTTEESAQ